MRRSFVTTAVESHRFGLRETDDFDLESVWFAPLSRPPIRRPLGQAITTPTSAQGQRGAVADEWVAPVLPEKVQPSQGVRVKRFHVVGRWWGWVTAVGAETFSAQVEDLMWGSPPHLVELPRTLVSPYDDELLRENGVFYWTIGYRQRTGGTRVQEAVVRFRRAPAREPWMEKQAEDWAVAMQTALNESSSY